MRRFNRFTRGLFGSLFRLASYEFRGLLLTVKIRCSSCEISKNI